MLFMMPGIDLFWTHGA